MKKFILTLLILLITTWSMPAHADENSNLRNAIVNNTYSLHDFGAPASWSGSEIMAKAIASGNPTETRKALIKQLEHFRNAPGAYFSSGSNVSVEDSPDFSKQAHVNQINAYIAQLEGMKDEDINQFVEETRASDPKIDERVEELNPLSNSIAAAARSQALQAAAAEDDSKTWEFYQRNIKSKDGENSCWLCPFYEQFYAIIISLSYGIIGESTDGDPGLSAYTQTFLGVMMGIWLLFEAAKLILPLGPAGAPAQIFNGIVVKLFLVMVVISLINPNTLWNRLLTPAFSIGVDLSAHVLTQTLSAGGTASASTLDTCMNSPVTDVPESMVDNPIMRLGMTLDGFNVEPNTKNKILKAGKNVTCIFSGVQEIFGAGVALGAGHFMRQADFYDLFVPVSKGVDELASRISSEAALFGNESWFISPEGAKRALDPAYKTTYFEPPGEKTAFAWISGLALIVAFFMPIVTFPLYVMGAFFRFAIAAMISPIWVACYIFKPLQRVSKVAIHHVMEAGMILVFQCLIVALCMGYVEYAFDLIITQGGGSISGQSFMNKFETITKMMGESKFDVDDTNYYNPESGYGQLGVLRFYINESKFWFLMLGAMMSVFLMGQATSLVQVFLNYDESGISTSRTGAAMADVANRQMGRTISGVASVGGTLGVGAGAKTASIGANVGGAVIGATGVAGYKLLMQQYRAKRDAKKATSAKTQKDGSSDDTKNT